MAMNPEDITGKTFQTKFMGLHPDDVKAHLEQVAGEFTRLTEQLGKLEQTIADQSKELELAADDKKAFEDVVDVFKDNIEKLKSELRVKEQNGLELLRELESTGDQITELGRQRDSLKGELNGKETQISELESKYRMSRAAVDELRKKQVMLESENADLKERAAEHEQLLGKAREEVSSLNDQARYDSSRLLEAAREEIERMRTDASLEIVQVKDDIEVLSARRNQIHSELRALLNDHLRRLDDFTSGDRERNNDVYGDLFQSIDFTELAELEEEPPIEEDDAAGAAGPDGEDRDAQLKNQLEDGGIAYLSGE